MFDGRCVTSGIDPSCVSARGDTSCLYRIAYCRQVSSHLATRVKDNHDIILEYVRSKPTLQPVSALPHLKNNSYRIDLGDVFWCIRVVYARVCARAQALERKCQRNDLEARPLTAREQLLHSIRSKPQLKTTVQDETQVVLTKVQDEASTTQAHADARVALETRAPSAREQLLQAIRSEPQLNTIVHDQALIR